MANSRKPRHIVTCNECGHRFSVRAVSNDRFTCPNCGTELRLACEPSQDEVAVRTAGGAVGGAILGASIGGPVGAIIGGVIGAIVVAATAGAKQGGE